MVEGEGGQPLDLVKTARRHTFERQVDPSRKQSHLDFRNPLRRDHSAQQMPQRIYQPKQFRPKDVAFVHIHDAVRLPGIESDEDLRAGAERLEGRAPSASWRR